MRFTFGLYLDGPVAPDPLAGREASLGEATGGPERLLGVLECHLGLGGDWQPEPVRALQYRARLGAADDGRRFYSNSYRKDPLGTATTLLRWREELIAGGWDGRAPGRARGRLADLAAVEAVGGLRPLDPGPASRLRAVMAALQVRRAPISHLRLIEPLDMLGPPWPDVFDLLERQGSQLELAEDLPGAGSGSLRTLQRSLAREGARGTEPCDGSLVVLRASSDTEAAEAVALWLDSIGHDAVVISQAGDDTLDRALARHGMPATGAKPDSPWRPALQILPLAVAMRWEPLDPRRLLEFLLIPGGPLSRFVATTLARAVAREPGIGGPEWSWAMKKIETAARAGKLTSMDSGPRTRRSPEEAWAEQQSLIQDWLLAPRADPEHGLAREELIALCARVSQWAGSILALDPRDEVAGASRAQAATLRGMLELLDEPLVPQLLWQSLLEQATGRGIPLPRARGEAGHARIVRHPGAIVGTVANLVWWDFVDETADRPAFNPWTQQERAQLERAGVALEAPSLAIEREADAAARAMRSAACKLVLVVPAVRRGEATSAHPEMARVSTALGETLTGCTFDARHGLPLEPVSPRKLPALKRWWRLPEGLRLEGGERETYTSLSDFINHPFHWVLKYPAALTGGALQPMLPTRRLLGNLAHRLLQDCLQEKELLAAGAPLRRLREFIERRMAILLEEEGAVLLLPARQPDRRRLAGAVARSVGVLAERMRDGGWRLDSSVGRRGLPGVEISCEAKFAGGTLQGYLDLLLANERDERLVLDLKWGRHMPGQEIPLQLLVYAQLIRERTGRWPRIAHFFLEQSTLYPADALGPPGRVRAEWTEADCAAQWPACEAAWQWRREQLDRGLIEVTVPGTEPCEDSQPPDGARAPEGDCRFNEYATLVGWTAPAPEDEP